MRILSTAAIAALALAGTASAQGVSVNPGMWTYDTTMDISMNMNGQAMDMPGQTTSESQCVTEADATFDPANFTEPGCSISNLQETSSTVSFTMTCNQQGMTMTGDMLATVTDGGNGMDMTMKMNGNQPGMGTMDINGVIKGKRTGDC
jgi:hypothetical protein